MQCIQCKSTSQHVCVCTSLQSGLLLSLQEPMDMPLGQAAEMLCKQSRTWYQVQLQSTALAAYDGTWQLVPVTS